MVEEDSVGPVQFVQSREEEAQDQCSQAQKHLPWASLLEEEPTLFWGSGTQPPTQRLCISSSAASKLHDPLSLDSFGSGELTSPQDSSSQGLACASWF